MTEGISLYVTATINVTYAGSVPIQIELDPTLFNLQTQTDYNDGEFNAVAFGSVQGGITCGQDAYYNVQPYQTLTLNIWADLRVLSNTHPGVTPADTKYLLLTTPAYFALSFPDANDPTAGYSVSGTQAAKCVGHFKPGFGQTGVDDTEKGALIYNKPPMKYAYNDQLNGHVTGACSAS